MILALSYSNQPKKLTKQAIPPYERVRLVSSRLATTLVPSYEASPSSVMNGTLPSRNEVTRTLASGAIFSVAPVLFNETKFV